MLEKIFSNETSATFDSKHEDFINNEVNQKINNDTLFNTRATDSVFDSDFNISELELCIKSLKKNRLQEMMV